jgi:hypothetical protein
MDLVSCPRASVIAAKLCPELCPRLGNYDPSQPELTRRNGPQKPGIFGSRLAIIIRVVGGSSPSSGMPIDDRLIHACFSSEGGVCLAERGRSL